MLWTNFFAHEMEGLEGNVGVILQDNSVKIREGTKRGKILVNKIEIWSNAILHSDT